MKIELKRASKKLLEENVKLKREERVTIVTDRKNCPIFKTISLVAKEMGANLTEVRITRKRNHSSPLPHLKQIFAKSDIIIGITDKSISHCPETRLARKKYGARVISMVEVDEKLFLKAFKTDQIKVKKIGNKLAKKLEKCKEVRILTPSGTDLLIKTTKDIGIDDGDCSVKGKLSNFPYGEVCIAPINIANGILAIDFSRVGIKPEDNVKLILIDGKIIWGNNEKAKKFIKYLRKAGGEKALKVVELGFGINPAHKNLVGKIIHDEKILGSAHIAFGGFGNKRKCKIHEDVILLKPTVFFDERLVIKEGKLEF